MFYFVFNVYTVRVTLEFSYTTFEIRRVSQESLLDLYFVEWVKNLYLSGSSVSVQKKYFIVDPLTVFVF